MLRTYKYRIYPTIKQSVKILHMLDLCRHFYNAALAQRIYAYDRDIKIGYFNQQNDLPHLKEIMPEFKDIYSQALQMVLRRVDTAYANFFRRCKEKKAGKKIEVGFPKFKSRLRFRSLTYPQVGFELLNPTHLKVSKIGILRIFQHRPIPGIVKTMTIKHDLIGDWWVTFSVELPNAKPVKAKTKVGVDVGLKNLAVVSSGDFFASPKFLIKGLAKVKALQRQVSRSVIGSNNRNKLRIRLARAHRKIERQRDDYLHKISKNMVDKYDIIVFEDLKITNMVRNHNLARAILDASWGKLQEMTAYKAENAGKQVLFGDPRHTSQTCHVCGTMSKISLSDRIFSCRKCGQTTDRDLNASFNIRESVGPDWTELLNNARRDMTDTLKFNASQLHEAGSPCL